MMIHMIDIILLARLRLLYLFSQSKTPCPCRQLALFLFVSALRSYLQSRSIDIKNAETFFRMLVELQGETTIDATTFANACVRMKGAATSIDLQTVMFTTHLMNRETYTLTYCMMYGSYGVML